MYRSIQQNTLYTFEGIDSTVTQDELDYYLKAKLRVPPEQRYQDKKEDWFFHVITVSVFHNVGFIMNTEE